MTPRQRLLAIRARIDELLALPDADLARRGVAPAITEIAHQTRRASIATGLETDSVRDEERAR